nr:phosphoglycolate phosphatase [Kandeliimicrobium roseum]
MVNVIFDLDGTLIDSAPDIRFAVNKVLEENGAAPLDLPTVIGFIGNGTSVLMDKVIAARDLDRERHGALLERLMDFYEGATSRTTLYPGCLDALDTLREAGHRLGLCTNKPLAPARDVLAHFDLARRMDTVYGGDSLPQKKPDPAPLLAAMRDLGGGPTLYVGDSEVDGETAERAGLAFALFTEGYRHVPVAEIPHAHAFDHFDALPDIVAGLRAG